MCKGERALFVVPASAMQAQPPVSSPGDATSQLQGSEQQAGGLACLLPPPPAKAVQLEVELELLSVIQVRPHAAAHAGCGPGMSSITAADETGSI
jgi:hypothetical protein